jgi:sarcosine oxidase subunit beta
MTSSADAVVIGGGILGVSTAHFLAKLGYGTIVLLEKKSLAAVSTGHSAAAIRTFYSNPLTIQLAKRAVEMFSNASQELGGDCGFNQVGYMTLLSKAALKAGRQVVEMERQAGITVEELTRDDVHERLPMVDLENVDCAFLEPDSGYVDPVKTTQTMASSVKGLGLDVFEGVGATGIRLDNGRVTGVDTEKGMIETRVVVNAAGGWGGQVGSWVGLKYSLRWSREVDIVLEVPFETEAFPWLSDPQIRFYTRQAGPRQLLVGLGFPKEIEPLDIENYNEKLDDPTRERIEGYLYRRIPSSHGSKLLRGWASMYTITDDWHPLVGPEEEIPGYYACVGGNGHCFKLGPPIGESLAHMIAGKQPPADLHQLRPGRFMEGDYFTSVWGSGNRA